MHYNFFDNPDPFFKIREKNFLQTRDSGGGRITEIKKDATVSDKFPPIEGYRLYYLPLLSKSIYEEKTESGGGGDYSRRDRLEILNDSNISLGTFYLNTNNKNNKKYYLWDVYITFKLYFYIDKKEYINYINVNSSDLEIELLKDYKKNKIEYNIENNIIEENIYTLNFNIQFDNNKNGEIYLNNFNIIWDC